HDRAKAVVGLVADLAMNSIPDHLPSGHSKIDPAILPESYSLLPNYPNPFKSVTHITFGLPAESSVILTIYTIIGHFATNLVHDWFYADYHTVTWDGSEYSSGIYLVRLAAGNFVKTHKDGVDEIVKNHL
ncbi:MAG: T9SS type A sorting domain-containing protein, partial [Candidatus Marinimicrobia bacterium]|nr:T9SS type A sorting domain-containing protein [Candidatus Neomarinimicrobiota bacterium]